MRLIGSLALLALFALLCCRSDLVAASGSCGVELFLIHSATGVMHSGQAEFRIERIADRVELAPQSGASPGLYRFEGPCGYYDLQIRASGFQTVNLNLPVFGDVARVPIYLVLGQIGSEPHLVLKGSVVDDDLVGRRIWVKVARVRGVETVTSDRPMYLAALVDSTGQFKLEGMSPGTYSVLVFEDLTAEQGEGQPFEASELLAARVLTLRQDYSVERAREQQPAVVIDLR